MDDPDNPEWTEEDFANARLASEVHGPELAAKMIKGQPQEQPSE